MSVIECLQSLLSFIKAVITAIAPIGLPIAVLLAGKWVKDAVAQQQVNLEWVRAALDILRDDSDLVRPMRAWAIQIVNHHSAAVKIDELTRDKLISGDAKMAPPTSPQPVDFREGVKRFTLARTVKEACLALLAGMNLPIEDASFDVDTTTGDLIARARLAATTPGGFSGPTSRITKLVDWKRWDDDVYVKQLAQEIANDMLADFRLQKAPFTVSGE